MARSRSSQRKPGQPESKKALIIFLVFFILTTIGGGLFGYQGFIADEGKDKAVKDEKAKTSAAEVDRDFYMYQALLCRFYMGHLKQGTKAEYDKMNKQFLEVDPNVLFTSHKDRQDIVELRKLIETRLNTIIPPGGIKTYEKALEIKTQEAKTALDAGPAQVAAKVVTEKERDDAKNELTALKGDEKAPGVYARELKALEKRLDDGKAKDLTDKKVLEEEKNKAQDNFEKKSIELAEFQKKTAQEKILTDRRINKLTEDLVAAQTALNIYQAKSKDIEVPELQSKAVGRIVERKGESDTVFINLGSIQKMTPQMTFSIHSVGADGKAFSAVKGNLEVVNVFEAGSQCRIVIEKNKNDPIQQGDVIVNPNWNPDRKRHVAIAGLIDMDGEGRNQLREFRQLLERQNIIVDAYLEPAGPGWVTLPDGKGTTRETNFLIIGDELLDSKAERLDKTELVKQARANGVLTLNLRNYLDLIGYQPPRRLSDNSGYRPVVVQPDKPK